MKTKLSSLGLFLVAFLISGCAIHRPIGTTSEVGLIDTLPSDSSKGYVEFYTASASGPVPIYLIDTEKNSHLLAGVGLDSGDKYHRRQGMKVTERLRVAAPAGTHTFAVGKGGQVVEVPVEADKVTCVELNYQPVERAEHFDIYRLNYAVAEPVSAPDSVGAAPRAE